MKLTIAQIVLERCEFKHRDDYLTVPTGTPAKQSDVVLSSQILHATDAPKDKVLVRFRANSEPDSTYQFDVTYAILFNISWGEGEAVPADLDKRLVVTGCTMLLPFVREVVASMTARGKFGPVWLAPTNIDAMVAEPGANTPNS